MYHLLHQNVFKTFSGTFSGETLNINDHGFYTGESVYYTPQRTQTTVEIDGEDVIDTSIHVFFVWWRNWWRRSILCF